MTGRSSNPKPSCFLSVHPQKTWAHCDFLPFFFLWVFGAELPREEWWKESLTAGSCLVITVLKIGVWEVPAAALLRLRFGDSGGSVSPCHRSACPVHVFPEFTETCSGLSSGSPAKPRLCGRCCCHSACKHSVGGALRGLCCFGWLLRVESHPGTPRPVGPPGHLPALGPLALHP